MGSDLRFGPLGPQAVHLCVDMQTLFAERTDWHVPWLERVLPVVAHLAEARRERTVFTRFVPPERPEDAAGAWRRYYAHWREMTGERLDPRLIQLVPPLAALTPPAIIIDKSHYSPFSEPAFLEALGQHEIEEHDEKSPILDLVIVAGMQRIEHYEIAAYGTDVALAEALGEKQVAKLLSETLDEEKQTDLKLTEVTQKAIMPDALAGEEEEEEGGDERGGGRSGRRRKAA